MSKSLAELRQSPHVGLPERSYSLCLASALVGEVQSLWEDLKDAEARTAAQADGDGDRVAPRRAGEKSPAAAIRGRLAELQEEMLEHTGKLGLRGIRSAEWNAWVAEHPAREGNLRDSEYAYGICDADALLADLGQFAVSWNGDPITPADWEFITGAAIPGDMNAIVQVVVAMHETAVNVPKLLSAWLATPGAETT